MARTCVPAIWCYLRNVVLPGAWYSPFDHIFGLARQFHSEGIWFSFLFDEVVRVWRGKFCLFLCLVQNGPEYCLVSVDPQCGSSFISGKLWNIVSVGTGCLVILKAGSSSIAQASSSRVGFGWDVVIKIGGSEWMGGYVKTRGLNLSALENLQLFLYTEVLSWWLM